MTGVSLFVPLAIILVIATIMSSIFRALKQPPIVGYIITGIVTSPIFLNLIEFTDSISHLSKIGVALLLFMVGLHLNPKSVKNVGKVTILVGFGQILLTFIIGFGLALLFNFSVLVSFYIAIAFTFSSTIIIMKLLSDKRELETLYGKISIGILLIQDLVVVFLMIVITSFKDLTHIKQIAISMGLKGMLAIIILWAVSYFIMPKVDSKISKSQELLFLFALTWCLALGVLFEYIGFSLEIGALIAGISLSILPSSYEISSRITPLRDFFIILFFILLGSQMEFTNIFNYLIPIIVFSLFVFVIKPVIIMFLMGSLKYTKKTSFFTASSLGQISEFSFILMALGLSIGHITKDVFSLVTMVGLITIALSTYMIKYSDKVYVKIKRILLIFERKGKKIDESKFSVKQDFDIILFGYNRIGFDLLSSLQKIKKDFLVVDFNPDTIKELQKRKIHARYGDAGDSELLDDINFKSAKMVISTIPDTESNLLLLKKVREKNKKVLIIVVSYDLDEAFKLYDKGATYVLMPHYLGGLHIGTMIEDYGFDIKKFLKEQVKQIERLKKHYKYKKNHPIRREEAK